MLPYLFAITVVLVRVYKWLIRCEITSGSEAPKERGI